jgi:hypothetical protein
MSEFEGSPNLAKEEHINHLINSGRKTMQFFSNLNEPFQSEVQEILLTNVQPNTCYLDLINGALKADQLEFTPTIEGWGVAVLNPYRKVSEPILRENGDVSIYLFTQITKKVIFKNEVILREKPSPSIPGAKVWEIELVVGTFFDSEKDAAASTSDSPRLILRHGENTTTGYLITQRKVTSEFEERGIPKVETSTQEVFFMCKGKRI